jgi:transcriptional regulator with GAF, ATPase, and Fis domain
MADVGGLIDVHHLFTSGETLAPDVMTLKLQDGAGTLNLAPSLSSSPAVTAAVPSPVPSAASAMSLEQTERAMLQRAISGAQGNLSAAARLLNTTRAKLAYRARKHGLV